MVETPLLLSIEACKFNKILKLHLEALSETFAFNVYLADVRAFKSENIVFGYLSVPQIQSLFMQGRRHSEENVIWLFLKCDFYFIWLYLPGGLLI